MQASASDPEFADSKQHSEQNAHLKPPFVQIEGIFNCRFLPLPSAGLGGTDNSEYLNTISDSKPKPWIFRSGDISRITLRGAEQLGALGIRTVFDLRSESDVARFSSPAPVIDGVDILKASVLPSPAPGKDGGWYGEDSSRKVYREYLEDEQGAFMRDYSEVLEVGKEEIAKILRHLISQRSGHGVLFHCNAGKDRTGALAALLLLLAGQNETTIIQDYALTTTGIAPVSSVLLKTFEKSEAFQENREGAMNLFSSRPITMHNFLELIRTKYGGAEEYVKNVAGLNQTELDTLKIMLVN